MGDGARVKHAIRNDKRPPLARTVRECTRTEKFKRDRAPKRANRNWQRPIIATQMPPVPVVRSLYSEVVGTLGGNVRRTARFYELEHAATLAG
jgi:hypothetical protein